MAKKYYAVRNGRRPGIYTSWDECKSQVTGYPDAAFKGFMTEAEAREFIGLAPETAGTVENAGAVETQCAAAAYCDGSYHVKTKMFSCGVVIFHEGEKITYSCAFSDPELSAMRNVAGELKGAEYVMAYCIEKGIPSVEIFYDYQGIEKWCTGEWKTNKAGTKAYKAYYDAVKERLAVRFTKVKGHSGDKYNDMADRLAKNALGID